MPTLCEVNVQWGRSAVNEKVMTLSKQQQVGIDRLPRQWKPRTTHGTAGRLLR